MIFETVLKKWSRIANRKTRIPSRSLYILLGHLIIGTYFPKIFVDPDMRFESLYQSLKSLLLLMLFEKGLSPALLYVFS